MTMDGRIARIISALLSCAYALHYAMTPQDWHFIDAADLIFHEAGHAIFSFFGDFIHVAMGSGFQILLPFFIALYFFYQRQALSGAICLMWTEMNLISVSIYAGDAIVMQLPLLGGDSVIHDWNYLLTELHMLRWTSQIAYTFMALGVTLTGLGVALSFWSAWSIGSAARAERSLT